MNRQEENTKIKMKMRHNRNSKRLKKEKNIKKIIIKYVS